MPAFSWSFRVRYHECDAQKIVFNANYFMYFDMTMTELLRASFPDGGYDGMVETHGVDVVVAEASAKLLRIGPLRRARSSCARASRASARPR